ncbi:MAG TPA: glutamate ABC transporter substrate-binding protein [Ilumatobacteraceae bacterium]|nr:glutamate ABC transporter substrate-binding protein [Ilumatobacteraceae bacterium]
MVTLTACSGDARLPDAIEVSVPTTTAPQTPAAPTCASTDQFFGSAAVASYPALDPLPTADNLPPGSAMAAIRARGRLIIGVSADTLQFGARNPVTGAIEGFDIDILKEVGKAIFGTDDPPIEYRVITYAQRLPVLENHEVDLVAHTMTINCNRWLRIAFSTEYFPAGQKVLVRLQDDGQSNLVPAYDSIEAINDFRGRICVPGGSTNLEEIQKPEYSGLQIVERVDITDCLVAFQQGQVNAITGDDTVLVGFAAQDPYAVVVGDAFTSEPYGVGIAKDQPELVQFVNGVLAKIRTDGTWEDIAARWIDAANIPPVPQADESRPLSGG